MSTRSTELGLCTRLPMEVVSMMADGLKDPVLVDKAAVYRLLGQYGLTDEQVHTLLQFSCIVNEVAIVLLHNYLHPESQMQLDPKSALSFRVHQTKTVKENEAEERRLGDIFNKIMPHSDQTKFPHAQGYLSQWRSDSLSLTMRIVCIGNGVRMATRER